MRILQINSVCYGSTGGVACGIARLAVAGGHQALVCYGRGKGPKDLPAFAMEGKGEVGRHVLRARLLDGMGEGSSAATNRLIETIEEFRPDVIHLHNLHGYYLNCKKLFDYLKGAAVPTVWTLHDCWAFTGHCAYFDCQGCNRYLSGCGDCPRPAGEYPARWGMDRSGHNYENKRAWFTGVENLTLVTPSQWLKELAAHSLLGAYPIRAIPNGIDLGVFCPTPSDLRTRYDLENRRVILGVANIWEPRKNLAGFCQLHKRLSPDNAIVLIGLTKKQIQGLPEGILGLPRTDGPAELAAWYTAADLFCDLTLEENFPTTHLEALACGTPVLTYDTGGSGEMLTGYCGAAVPTGDLDALTAAIPKTAALHGADCTLRAARYDRTERLGDYLNLYEEMMNKNSDRPGEAQL